VLYLDSSVLLADYLDQPTAAAARAAWDRDEERVSSVLIAVEVPIVLRRALGGRSAAADALLEGRLRRFDEDVSRVSLLTDLAASVARIRQDPRFSASRSLDALHAAAAFEFHEATEGQVSVLTADRRLAALCSGLGLATELLA
jgi:hypothetical protein